MFTYVDYSEVMATLDNMVRETESQIDEYIKYDEYTLEEQRYDEGYIAALEWAMAEIGVIYANGVSRRIITNESNV